VVIASAFRRVSRHASVSQSSNRASFFLFSRRLVIPRLARPRRSTDAAERAPRARVHRGASRASPRATLEARARDARRVDVEIRPREFQPTDDAESETSRRED